jgi:uncharacterized protein (TIGR03437 family)
LIYAGYTSTAFPATAGTVASGQTATLTATYNASAQTTVNVVANLALASLSCTPSSIASGASTTCTVTLNAAAATPATVTLVADNLDVTLPPSISIASGLASGTFTLSTTASAAGSIAIQASMNGGAISTQVSIGGPALVSVSCSPAAITAPGTAQCTISLGGIATASGFSIAVSSNNSVVTVPSSVQIPGGASFTTFTATVGATTSPGNATLLATANGAVSTTLNYTTSPAVQSIVCTPDLVPANSTANCTVTLNAATAAQQNIALVSSNPGLTVPASVQVNPNQMTANFVATSGTPAQQQTVIVTANAAQPKSAVLSLLTTPAQLTVSAPALIAAAPGDAVQFLVGANSPQGLAISLAVSNLPSGAAFSPVLNTFIWTPQSNQTGANDVTFTATDSKGNTATAIVKINVGATRDAVSDGVNAASLVTSTVCSPGSIGAIAGIGFTTQNAATAGEFPLPLQLAGVQVLANGQAVPLLSVSGTWIEFQCPALAAGSALTVTVVTEDGTSINAFQNTMPEAAPGIYSFNATGSGQGSIYVANSPLLAMPVAPGIGSRPAHQGEYITIWANGLGPNTGGAPDIGIPAALAPLITATDSIQVVIGGTAVTPSFAGLAPTLVGTYQVNVQLPANMVTGTAVPVYLRITLSDGTVVQSNTVTMAVDEAVTE